MHECVYIQTHFMTTEKSVMYPFIVNTYIHVCICTYIYVELPWWLSHKEPTCQCRKREFHLWVGKIPWRREWLATPVFLPGKSHGQRSLLGYSPWSCKELDTAEGLKNNNAYSVCVCVCVFARTRVCVLPMCQNHARPWGFRDDSGRALCILCCLRSQLEPQPRKMLSNFTA